jgi:hypothetical protein
MIFPKYAVALISISFFSSIESHIVIAGDSNAPAGASFSFNVFPSAGAGSLVFLGRSSATDLASEDSIRHYSLSAFATGNTTFLPVAVSKVTLNGVLDQPNPLIGQNISAVGIFVEKPVVACGDTPSDLYAIASALGKSPVSVNSCIGLKDAQGALNSDGSVTAGIAKIASSGGLVFAGVKKSGGTLGQVGSGIAVLQPGLTNISQIAAVLNDSGIKAVPLDGTLPFLKIGSTPTIDGTVFDMFWDDYLQRLYIVFKSTGGAAGTDGAVGIAMGYLKGVSQVNELGKVIATAKLVISEIVPAVLFTGTNTIIGGVGSSTVARLSKVRVTHTTTGLSYLIVVGNASSTNNLQTVYALPLVDKKLLYGRSTAWASDPTHGVIASKAITAGVNPRTFYDGSVTPACIRGRAFQTPTTATNQLPVETDQAAKVGAGIAIGAIQDIAVYKDAVFISTIAGDNDVAGVFSSQALFDVNGAIKAWTPWQRVVSAPDSDTNFFGIYFDSSQDRLIALQGASSATVDTVFTTTWSPGDNDGVLGGTPTDASAGLNGLLQSTFANTGGVFGLFDFSKETVGFSTTVGTRTSLMVATGYKKIVLVQTGQDNGDDYFIPQIGSFLGTDNKIFTGGTISSAPTSNTVMMTMSGGSLDTLGAITSAGIVKETGNGYGMYIVAGGTGGLAVLRATNGNGSSDLQKSFNGLNNFSWVGLGSYTNIRKVLVDGQNLYVITPTTCDRIPLAQLHGDALTPFTVATPAALSLPTYGSFSDAVISGNFALLATSNGLYTTGTGGVVATATTTTGPLWKQYALSEGPTSVTRLAPFTTTGFAYDVAKNTAGGQIDVLASSVSQKLSSLYRLTVADATGGVTDTTVQSIPDGIVFGTTGPYANLGEYKNCYTTDGAVPLVTRSLYLTSAATLQALPRELGLGVPLTGVNARHTVTIPFQNAPTRISGIVRNSAVGSTIVVTDNGLQILE